MHIKDWIWCGSYSSRCCNAHMILSSRHFCCIDNILIEYFSMASRINDTKKMNSMHESQWRMYCSEKLTSIEVIPFISHANSKQDECNALVLYEKSFPLHIIIQAHNFHKYFPFILDEIFVIHVYFFFCALLSFFEIFISI